MYVISYIFRYNLKNFNYNLKLGIYLEIRYLLEPSTLSIINNFLN